MLPSVTSLEPREHRAVALSVALNYGFCCSPCSTEITAGGLKKANIFTTTTFTWTTSLAQKAFLFHQENYRTRDEVISFGDCHKKL